LTDFNPLTADPDRSRLRLHFVRDASAARADGRCIGQTDLRLSASGRRESLALAHRLALPDATYISSDLERARATANLLTVSPVISEPRLREMHFGEWEGRYWADLDVTDGIYAGSYSDAWTTVRAPGGESFDDVVARITQWLEALPRTDGDLLAVAHAGSIRAAAVVLLGIPAPRAFSLALDHAHVSTFELTAQGASLIRWNSPGY
jgi:broad specificity phosphatase PhoE